MKRVIGTVTIGQSPRVDLIPEMKAILGPDVEIIEGGALDGLSLEEVKRYYPGPDDYVLVTRMADGTEVKIAKRHIIGRMQAQIDRLVREGAEVIALVCTGEFPPFKCDRLIVEPQKVLYGVTRALALELKLGVVIPDQSQVPAAYRKWSGAAREVRVEAASPYSSGDDIVRASKALREWGAQVVVMDCIGYTLGNKAVVKEIVGGPVILARSVVARVLSELVS
ncbi:MAG: AroM family protein [Candidatus Fermentithermobacillus carboniphilus]|uniref:AroM family protein n=1 Tax=Candidatus Fermentithermobacillus carboniphilus TaxID=3085328 RepID=A0AAT9LBW4_9FIRM|nr:MAG: AroM family protein [Candidatus Fermentithermobacillus carboniphilus]